MFSGLLRKRMILQEQDKFDQTSIIVEPFVQENGEDFYNPMRGETMKSVDPLSTPLRLLKEGLRGVDQLADNQRQSLLRAGWLIEDSGEDLARRFRLKIATVEASSVCNQACYFCPVSTNRRDAESMSLEFYERVVEQVAQFRETLDGVFMINYNEPTVDPRFLDQVKILTKHGLKAAVNTNGNGLMPSVVDEVMKLGGLGYLSVNLSTIDKENYIRDRGRDHLDKVLRNLDYVKNLPLAAQMDIAVLGEEDEEHERQFDGISKRFEGSHFTVKKFPIMNRGGWIEKGNRPPEAIRELGGCENLGSRPIEHVHINPKGECIMCCQDYGNDYVIGDLRESDLADILSGDKAATIRRQVYGMEEAPDDFLCRRCTFALCKSRTGNIRESVSANA